VPNPHIDREKCQGHGVCAAVADGIFDIGGDGKAITLDGWVSTDDHADLDEAIALCPEKAISVSSD
jgi:ferredoxin